MEKRGIRLTLILLSIISLTYLVLANTPTSLVILDNNVPPQLKTPIPNQTWATDSNITNAFDLDDHFLDNETLTFNHTSVENVTITINSSTNQVSFYSDSGFEGLRYVVFTASDTLSTTNSNNVTLNITSDNEPPQFSNVAKDLSDSQIFQNIVVDFSTSWTDNLQLFKYLLSIKQESGWTNKSEVFFSGTSNTSTQSVQISAPGGTQVLWKFIAWDTYGNLNETSEQSFTVSSTSSSSSDDDDDASTSTTTTTAATSTQTTTNQGYQIDPATAFNIEVLQGQSRTVTIKFSNTGNIDLTFNLELYGLDQFVKTISSEEFTVSVGDSKTVTLEFSSDKRLPPDIYYGGLKVITPNSVAQEVPIAIVVKPFIVSMDLQTNVLDEFNEVLAGDPVTANLTIKNLEEIESTNLTLYTAITNFQGDVFDSSLETVVFNKRATTLEKSLIVPQGTQKGEYLFLARISYDEETLIDTDIFTVGERLTVAAFIKSNYLLLIALLALIAIPLMILKYQREKEKLRLLNLYMLIAEMEKLLEKGDTEKAFDIYVKIKSSYGEKVSNSVLNNKEALKQEMQSFIAQVKSSVPLPVAQVGSSPHQDSTQSKDEKARSKNESDSKEENNKEKSSEDKDQEQPKEKKDSASKEESSKEPPEQQEKEKTETDSSKSKDENKKESSNEKTKDIEDQLKKAQQIQESQDTKPQTPTKSTKVPPKKSQTKKTVKKQSPKKSAKKKPKKKAKKKK